MVGKIVPALRVVIKKTPFGVARHLFETTKPHSSWLVWRFFNSQQRRLWKNNRPYILHGNYQVGYAHL